MPLGRCCFDVAVAIFANPLQLAIFNQTPGELRGAIPRASNLIHTTAPVVTVGWGRDLLELRNYLVGEDSHGVHHDVPGNR